MLSHRLVAIYDERAAGNCRKLRLVRKADRKRAKSTVNVFVCQMHFVQLARCSSYRKPDELIDQLPRLHAQLGRVDPRPLPSPGMPLIPATDQTDGSNVAIPSK